MRGDEGLGHAAHRDEIESVRYERAVRGGNRDVLGLRTAADDAEDAVADGGRHDVRAYRGHDAREFHPGNVGRDTGRRGVVTGALQEVGAVQSRAVDPDHHPVRSRLRDRPLGELQMTVHDRDRTHEPAT